MRRAEEQNSNIQMIVLLAVLLLMGLIKEYTWEAPPPVCLGTQKALYQEGVSACMQQLFEENTTFTLDNSRINYFYWVIKSSQTEVTIRMFNQDSVPRILRMGIHTQTRKSLEGYPKRYSKVIAEGIEKSEEIHLSNQQSCETWQGQNCLIIIGYSLHSSESISMTINIQSKQAPWSAQAIFIFCFFGGLLGITLLGVLGLLIYESMRNRALDKLKYFGRYFPRQTMYDAQPNYYRETNKKSCNVCLKQIIGYQHVRKLLCEHVFHAECLNGWCCKRLSCPTCKQPLDEKSLKAKIQEIADKKKAEQSKALAAGANKESAVELQQPANQDNLVE